MSLFGTTTTRQHGPSSNIACNCKEMNYSLPIFAIIFFVSHTISPSLSLSVYVICVYVTIYCKMRCKKMSLVGATFRTSNQSLIRRGILIVLQSLLRLLLLPLLLLLL
uniref:Uncharacterized protein n=1 Tax=Anopheles minimus TaxID=112268 RepID=A0A182WPV1_9DIPT